MKILITSASAFFYNGGSVKRGVQSNNRMLVDCFIDMGYEVDTASAHVVDVNDYDLVVFGAVDYGALAVYHETRFAAYVKAMTTARHGIHMIDDAARGTAWQRGRQLAELLDTGRKPGCVRHGIHSAESINMYRDIYNRVIPKWPVIMCSIGDGNRAAIDKLSVEAKYYTPWDGTAYYRRQPANFNDAKEKTLLITSLREPVLNLPVTESDAALKGWWYDIHGPRGTRRITELECSRRMAVSAATRVCRMVKWSGTGWVRHRYLEAAYHQCFMQFESTAEAAYFGLSKAWNRTLPELLDTPLHEIRDMAREQAARIREMQWTKEKAKDVLSDIIKEAIKNG